MSPRCAALPISETPSGLKYSGKMVMMSMRTASTSWKPGAARLAAGVLAEQAGRRVNDQPPGSNIDLRHDRHNERDQGVIPGTCGRPDHEQVLAVVQHIGDGADQITGRRHRLQPDQV